MGDFLVKPAKLRDSSCRPIEDAPFRQLDKVRLENSEIVLHGSFWGSSIKAQ